MVNLLMLLSIAQSFLALVTIRDCLLPADFHMIVSRKSDKDRTVVALKF